MLNLLLFHIYFGEFTINTILFQRAFRYLQQAADAGNSNAMAYLGKVSHHVVVFSFSTFVVVACMHKRTKIPLKSTTDSVFKILDGLCCRGTERVECLA